MKNTRKLIPAVAMLLISVIMVSTASYAWFSMNTQVTATGMQVKAQAEGGIVISNKKDGATWTASADAENASVANLIPTSTANTTTWYHAVSDDANDANKAQTAAGAYTVLAVTDNTGLGNVTIGGETKAIYLRNDFFIKSSAEAISISSADGLYINSVDVELPPEQKTANLNKALRVAIVLDDGTNIVTKIFAPVTGGETNYKVNLIDTMVIAAGVKDTATTLKTIPAFSSTAPIKASIYVYFEGEDGNCKSGNLASVIDTIQVSVQFGTTKIS